MISRSFARAHRKIILSKIGTGSLSDRAKLFWEERKTKRYIDNAVRSLDDKFAATSTLEELDAWRGIPTKSPIYQFLWEIFASHRGDDDHEDSYIKFIPIDTDEGLARGRRAFEKAFSMEFYRELGTKVGADYKAALDGADVLFKTLCVEALMSRYSSIDELSLFEGATEDEVGSLKLKDMYVEPWLTETREQDETNEPVRALECLTAQAQVPSVSLVMAHFGYGKSLTSRMLAAHLAEKYLSSPDPVGSHVIPIRVVCKNDLRTMSHVDLRLAFERAVTRELGEIGHVIGRHADNALSMSDDFDFHIILDGLDEVLLSDTLCEDLFRELNESVSSMNGRSGLSFSVFSRPAAVSDKVKSRRMSLNQIKCYEIEKMDGNDSIKWVTGWNRSTSEERFVEPDSFIDSLDPQLAGIPIMLFMTAFSWPELRQHVVEGKKAKRSLVYDIFLRSMARGKSEHQNETHCVIEDSLKELNRIVDQSKWLEEQCCGEDGMLWLMSRIAWESYCLQGLTLDDIRQVYKEIGVEEQKIEQASLLALQVNIDVERKTRVFFQHKSFEEYLVALFWVESIHAFAKRKRKRPADFVEVLSRAFVGMGERVIMSMVFELIDLNRDYYRSMINGLVEYLDESEVMPDPSDNIDFRKERGVRLNWFLVQVVCYLGAGKEVPERIVEQVATYRRIFSLRAPICLDGIFVSRTTMNMLDDLFEVSMRCCHFNAVVIGKVRDSRLNGSVFNGCLFSAGLRRSHLTNCTFKNTRFSGGAIMAVNFRESRFEGCVFFDCIFAGVSFIDSKCNNVQLGGCDFSRVSVGVLAAFDWTGVGYFECKWPDGFNPESYGAIKLNRFTSLPSYRSDVLRFDD